MRNRFVLRSLAFFGGAFAEVLLGWPLASTLVAGPSAGISASGHYSDDDNAPRYIFLPADEAEQETALDPNDLPEIYQQVRWRSGQTLQWYINVNETGDPEFKNQILGAAAQWDGASTQLNWANSEELSASTADILFELKAGCPSGGTPGKYTITIAPGEWSAGGSKDSLRRANYVALATICVNSAPQRANDADRKEVLLHEMGHAYGLHDRYNTDLTCNSREVSVMDGVVSCGNGGIVTALDAERVKGFWGYGWPNAPAIGADVAGVPGDNPILSTPSSGVLRATWGDWAWWQTSFYLIVRWQYDWWPVWYTLTGSDRWRDDDVGAHGLMTDYPQVDMRLLEEDFNVQGGPNGAYYTACIASDNYGWGWAPMYCFYSEKVWISW